jgi:hypothetical protein
MNKVKLFSLVSIFSLYISCSLAANTNPPEEVVYKFLDAAKGKNAKKMQELVISQQEILSDVYSNYSGTDFGSIEGAIEFVSGHGNYELSEIDVINGIDEFGKIFGENIESNTPNIEFNIFMRIDDSGKWYPYDTAEVSIYWPASYDYMNFSLIKTSGKNGSWKIILDVQSEENTKPLDQIIPPNSMFQLVSIISRKYIDMAFIRDAYENENTKITKLEDAYVYDHFATYSCDTRPVKEKKDYKSFSTIDIRIPVSEEYAKNHETGETFNSIDLIQLINDSSYYSINTNTIAYPEKVTENIIDALFANNEKAKDFVSNIESNRKEYQITGKTNIEKDSAPYDTYEKALEVYQQYVMGYGSYAFPKILYEMLTEGITHISLHDVYKEIWKIENRYVSVPYGK